MNNPHRLHLVRVYLAFQGAIAVAIAIAFAFAPPRLLSGPSLADVLHVAPAAAWAVVFALTGLICEVGAYRLEVWRQAMVTLVAVQMMFALALTAPVFDAGRANVIAPLAWSSVVGTGIIIWEYSRRLERR